MTITVRLWDTVFAGVVLAAVIGCAALAYGPGNPNRDKLPPPTTQQVKEINDTNARLDKLETTLEGIKTTVGTVAVVAPGTPASSTASTIAAGLAGLLAIERLLRTYVAPAVKGSGTPGPNDGTSPSASGTVTLNQQPNASPFAPKV